MDANVCYMTVTQYRGEASPYHCTFFTREAADERFEHEINDPLVTSCYLDRYTLEGRETAAFYHNNKVIREQVAASAGALASDGAAAPVFAPAC